MRAAGSVQITLSMAGREAWALAELCKRFTWESAVKLSNQHDGGAERDAMLEAVCHLARALDEQGIDPR